MKNTNFEGKLGVWIMWGSQICIFFNICVESCQDEYGMLRFWNCTKV